MKTHARNAMVLSALAALAASAALAQEAAPGPPAKVYVIRATVAPEYAAPWTRAVQKTVEAHAAHDAGNYWATYQMVTGGPDVEYVFLFPFAKFADLDGWESNRRILVEALGDNIGKQVAGVLDLATQSVDRVITYVPELSNTRQPPRLAPSAFFWEYNTKVAEGKMTEYAALMRRVVKAHAQSDSGLNWVAYGNALGGDREQVVYMVPFDKFADLDGWPAPGSVVGEVYGANDAARVGEAMNAISATTHRIWRFLPAMSRLPQ